MPTILGRDYDDSPWGATQFQMDLMNPLDLDLKWTAARLGYGSGIAFAGYAGASYVTGTPMPSMAVQSINRAFMTASRWRNVASIGVRFTPTVAVAAVPVALSAGYAYQYEKHVNEKVRDAHESGSSTPWYGPLASGFGSVV